MKTLAVGGPDGEITVPPKDETAVVLATPPASLADVVIRVDVGRGSGSVAQVPARPQISPGFAALTARVGAVLSGAGGATGFVGAMGAAGATAVALGVGEETGVGEPLAVAPETLVGAGVELAACAIDTVG